MSTLVVTRADSSKENCELVDAKRTGSTYLAVAGQYALLLSSGASSDLSHMWISTDDGTTKKYVMKKQTYTVTITQTANQTISVVCNGTTYTSTFTARYGDTYTASVASTSSSYRVGTISSSSGTITGDITISATAAILNVFTVTISQSSNQTITVVCGGTSHTSTFTANYGSTYTASVTADSGYTAGTISSSSGTISDNITITATAATKPYKTIVTSFSDAATEVGISELPVLITYTDYSTKVVTTKEINDSKLVGYKITIAVARTPNTDYDLLRLFKSSNSLFTLDYAKGVRDSTFTVQYK